MLIVSYGGIIHSEPSCHFSRRRMPENRVLPQSGLVSVSESLGSTVAATPESHMTRLKEENWKKEKNNNWNTPGWADLIERECRKT